MGFLESFFGQTVSSMSVGLSVFARLFLGIWFFLFAINLKDKASPLQLLISYAVIFTALHGYFIGYWLSPWFRGDDGKLSSEISAIRGERTIVDKARTALVTVQFFDWVIFMSWLITWIARHDKFDSLGSNMPDPTSPAFCSWMYLCNAFSLFGMVYGATGMGYLLALRLQAGTGKGSLSQAGRELEMVGAGTNSRKAYHIFTFFQFLMANIYTGWMFFMATGLTPMANVRAFFIMTMIMVGFWVLAVGSLSWAYYRNRSVSTLFFWVEAFTPQVFWIMWLGYNILFYINVYEKPSFNAFLGKNVSFDGTLATQPNFFLVWLPFQVLNGAVWPYVFYHLVTVVSAAAEAWGSADKTASIYLGDHASLSKLHASLSGVVSDVSAEASTWAVWAFKGVIGLIFAYNILYAWWHFTELLETRYLNNRLEGWAIAYTVIQGVLVLMILGFLGQKYIGLNIFGTGSTPFSRTVLWRTALTLTVIYFLNEWILWSLVKTYNGKISDPLDTDSLSDANIRNPALKVHHYYWAAMAMIFYFFYMLVIIFGETYSFSTITEFAVGGDIISEKGAVSRVFSLTDDASETAGDVVEGSLDAAGNIARTTVRGAASIADNVTDPLLAPLGPTNSQFRSGFASLGE